MPPEHGAMAKHDQGERGGSIRGVREQRDARIWTVKWNGGVLDRTGARLFFSLRVTSAVDGDRDGQKSQARVMQPGAASQELTSRILCVGVSGCAARCRNRHGLG